VVHDGHNDGDPRSNVVMTFGERKLEW